MKTVNKRWRQSIEKALIDKGFRKSAARKTAIRTIQKSIAKQDGSHKFTLRADIINGQPVMIKVYLPRPTP